MKIREIFFISMGFLIFSENTFAFQERKWTYPLSASFAVGYLKNADYYLNSRLLDSVSLEFSPQFRAGLIRVGPHFDYRLQRQLVSLSIGEGTNLSGNGWLLGLATSVMLFPRWSLQLAFDFLGQYDLAMETENKKQAYMSDPLSLRLKTGFILFPKLPGLTLDADAMYLNYQTLRIGYSDIKSRSHQAMIGIGLTYRWGVLGEEEPRKEKYKATKPAVTKIDLPPASFASGSSVLNNVAKINLNDVVNQLRKYPNAKISIDGHTDASGKEAANLKLSQDRADSVKEYLVHKGINPGKINAKGFGSSKPIALNSTSSGRAMNRRVQIILE